MHILVNISRSKGNQTMIFCQLVDHSKINDFLQKNHAENEAGRLVSNLFFFFKKALYEVKAGSLQLSFNIFQQPLTWHTIKIIYMKLQTIDSKICTVLIFQKRFWEWLLHHILCFIFQEKCLSYYILLTDKISLLDGLFVLRYSAICVLQMFIFWDVTS